MDLNTALVALMQKGFTITSRQDSDGFGYVQIILSRGATTLQITRDRGQVFVDITPKAGPTLALADLLQAPSDGETPFRYSLSDFHWAAFVKTIDQLDRLAHDQAAQHRTSQ